MNARHSDAKKISPNDRIMRVNGTMKMRNRNAATHKMTATLHHARHPAPTQLLPSSSLKRFLYTHSERVPQFWPTLPEGGILEPWQELRNSFLFLSIPRR